MQREIPEHIIPSYCERHKIPFDCLWFCMTRKYEMISHRHDNIVNIKPIDFDNW